MNVEGRTEVIGPFSITGFVRYLSDVQVWEPRIVIARIDGAEALMVGWAAARQWLDGGRIPWHALAAAGTVPE